MNSSHLSALKQKHADLESRLEKEETRPMPDEVLIHGLKKQKLVLKDEMAREIEPA
ncbi:MAG: YdcH family protein [Sphingorhabdus sp.]